MVPQYLLQSTGEESVQRAFAVVVSKEGVATVVEYEAADVVVLGYRDGGMQRSPVAYYQ
jgi:hypothetical protein